jgi:hypothetical protein
MESVGAQLSVHDNASVGLKGAEQNLRSHPTARIEAECPDRLPAEGPFEQRLAGQELLGIPTGAEQPGEIEHHRQAGESIELSQIAGLLDPGDLIGREPDRSRAAGGSALEEDFLVLSQSGVDPDQLTPDPVEEGRLAQHEYLVPPLEPGRDKPAHRVQLLFRRVVEQAGMGGSQGRGALRWGSR